MKNENVSNIDWDMIEKCKNPSNFIQHYISSLVDKDSLNLLRERMNSGESEENKIAEEICEFYKKNGHLPIQMDKLGKWISKLRKKIREGDSPYESTVKILDKAGIWEKVSCLNIYENKENEMAEEICAYYKKNGHLPIQIDKFGKWIYRLRYKIKKGYSPYESTIKMFKKAGIWEEAICLNNYEIKENEIAEEICAYYKKNGHLPTQMGKLGSWIGSLRQKIKKGYSPYESTIKMFKKAGIWEEAICLNIREIKDNEAAEEVCDFYKKNGHLPSYIHKSGRWINKLRQKLRQGGSPYESTAEILNKAGIWDLVVGKD